jgi:hypothetical protein
VFARHVKEAPLFTSWNLRSSAGRTAGAPGEACCAEGQPGWAGGGPENQPQGDLWRSIRRPSAQHTVI